MSKTNRNESFAVLGLGRFGMSIVEALSQADVSILACDKDEQRLKEAAEFATHVVQIDMLDEKVLSKLGLGNFDVVILATGDDFEASQIAAMIAKENGANWVIAKAANWRQKIILEKIGANEVILPECEMGAKLARKLLGSNIMDILEESDIYTISEMTPMREWCGKTLENADIRRKSNLTVLAIRRGDKLIIPVSPSTVILEDDILVTLSENK